MAIADIIELLGALSFTVDSQSTDAWFDDDFDQKVEEADLPLRIIRLVSGELQEIEFLSGKTSVLTEMQWVVRDRLLIVPVGQVVTSLSNIEPLLLDYANDYIVSMAANFNQPTTTGELVGVSIQSGTFEYPEGTGDSFHGVQCVVTVKQHLV